MAAGPDARRTSEPPLGASAARDAGLGPISPELALVDPVLARQARALLPEPPGRPQPRPPLPEAAAPEPPARPEGRRPRRWARALALAIVIFAAGAASGSFLGNHESGTSGTTLEVRAAASSSTAPRAALLPPTVAPAPTATPALPRPQRRRHARLAWASNVLGVEATVGRRSLTLRWRPPAGSAHVVVVRATGVRSRSVVVYRGRAVSFRDGSLRPCTGYRYTIVSYDRRGHRSTGVPTSVVTRCA